MEGKIKNFRMSRTKTSKNHMIVLVDGIDSKEKATKLVGKKVIFNTGKKDISGEIAAAHGAKGAVRVIFETGMPGQAIGANIKVQ
jgi:large subunit ribosomal protein L35Ae